MTQGSRPDALAIPAAARYSALRWNTPLSEAHAERLIEHLAIGPGAFVVDLGCGWGGLLMRAVASSNCTGIGVDVDRGHLERGRSLVRERGLQDHVEFVESSAEEWSRPADRIICIGASHSWG